MGFIQNHNTGPMQSVDNSTMQISLAVYSNNLHRVPEIANDSVKECKLKLCSDHPGYILEFTFTMYVLLLCTERDILPPTSEPIPLVI